MEKQKWSAERIQQQIDAANEDITAINHLLNKTFNAMSVIVEERIHLRKKMSRKMKYINKLEAMKSEALQRESA